MCEHLNFAAEVNVNRLTDEQGNITSYLCEIHTQCADCGMPFRFVCPDVGVLADKPATSPDGQELRVYVEPSDGSLQASARPPGFRIQASAQVPRHGLN